MVYGEPQQTLRHLYIVINVNRHGHISIPGVINLDGAGHAGNDSK